MPQYHEKGLIGTRSLRCYHIPSSTAMDHLFYFTHSGHFYVNRDYRIERRDGMLSEPYMLIYTVKGIMFLRQDGRTHHASENEILLFDCRKAHEYYSDRNSVYQFILFGGNSSDYYYDRLCPKGQHLIRPASPAAISQCLSAIIRDSDSSLPDEHLISAEIHRLLGLLVTPREVDLQNNAGRVRQVIRYMKEHIADDISMKDLSDTVNLNGQYLSRIFRQYTDTPPYEYLLNLRVARAKYLLTATSDSIVQIGTACGFRDTSHFIKIFKAKVQTTPLAYRKANQC